MRHYLVIVGARPNFVKAAPLFLRNKETGEVQFTLLHTGQHYDANMSQIFFDEMGLPKPDIHLAVEETSTSTRLGKMTHEITNALREGRYDGVIVIGDIDSTLAGALAGARVGLPIIHIEAGLRSHDARMPEEKNRGVVDHLSSLLLISDAGARENLLREGIPEERIRHVGNLMIESLERFAHVIDRSDVLSRFELTEKDYFVATVHRVENTEDPAILRRILSTLGSIAETKRVVFPLHPGTRARIEKFGLSGMLEGLMVTDPLGYFDFLRLVKGSAGVITDSGGIQEEATHLGIPCATLRDNTERPITVSEGTNALFPLESLTASEVLLHLSRPTAPNTILFWDTGVSDRILKELRDGTWEARDEL